MPYVVQLAVRERACVGDLAAGVGGSGGWGIALNTVGRACGAAARCQAFLLLLIADGGCRAATPVPELSLPWTQGTQQVPVQHG